MKPESSSGESRSPSEYRAASLRLFAGKRKPDDEWLVDELVAQIAEELSDQEILNRLAQKGGDANSLLLQRMREEYWRRTFQQASQDDQAGKSDSTAINKCRSHALILAASETSWNCLRDCLIKKCCSPALAEKLCDDPKVISILQENVKNKTFHAVMALIYFLAALLLGYFTGVIHVKVLAYAPLLIPVFVVWIFLSFRRRHVLRDRLSRRLQSAK